MDIKDLNKIVADRDHYKLLAKQYNLLAEERDRKLNELMKILIKAIKRNEKEDYT